MKCFIGIIVTLCVVDNISSVPVRNGLAYYRTPTFNRYLSPYPMHQTMLLHYNQPYSARSSHASEVTAFASGDRIGTGTGTYYQDVGEPASNIQPPPQPQSTNVAEPSPTESDGGNAISVADAFPEAEQDAAEDTEINQQQDVLLEPNPSISYEPLPQQELDLEPTKPVQSPPQINDEIESNEEGDSFPVNTKVQRPGSGKESWPLHNFFPISFGSTSGGAIAIANSFSTGKGGTAASRATAYGSSLKQKSKKLLS